MEITLNGLRTVVNGVKVSDYRKGDPTQPRNLQLLGKQTLS
jgi:hypothetical protein